MNIRTRLTYIFTLIVAAILVGISLTIYYFAALNRKSEFYENLTHTAITTTLFIIDIDDIDANMLRAMDKNNLTVLPEETVIIFDSLNRVYYKSDEELSHITTQTLEKVRQEKKLKWVEGNRQLVGIELAHKPSQPLVVIASALDMDGLQQLNYLKVILSVCLLAGVILAASSGWLFAGKALSPISVVVQEVDQINASNLYSRIYEGNRSDEIAHLSITFNRMLERLEAAFALQKNFVANASHELRTPLATIINKLEVLVLKKRDPHAYENSILIVLDELRELSVLYNNLLTLAQTGLDKPTLNFQKLQVDEILWQARSELLKKNEDYSISINFNVLPDDEKQLMISGDEQLLKSAFLNVIENACKFSAEKRVTIDIGIGEETVILKFTDSGIGILSEDMPKIFEPFFRAENAKSIPGHGIGLSLTQKIIVLHKGVLHIHSEPGKGTVATITLPQRCHF